MNLKWQNGKADNKKDDFLGQGLINLQEEIQDQTLKGAREDISINVTAVIVRLLDVNR